MGYVKRKLFGDMKLPHPQYYHNHISKEIIPWLNLHYPEDSPYYGRVFIGYKKKGTSGIYDLSRRNIDELETFISQMHISQNLDYYITANSFSGVERTTDDLFALHNIVIDVDCHGDDAEAPAPELAQAFTWLCSRDLWTTGDVPEPNSIVMTGRGVQYWWAIDPISIKLDWLYRRIVSWLLDSLEGVLDDNESRLRGLNIDRPTAKRLAGWFRLPLTYNTEGKRWGTLQIRKKERYSHQELLDAIPEDYIPRKEEKEDKPKTQTEYVPFAAFDADVLQDGSTAMARRLYQMVRLRAMRNAAIGSETRDLFCFITYCALLSDHDEQEAWKRLLAFNHGFKQPLKPRELEQMMRSAEEKQYRLTNEWIIDALNISEEEQAAIGMYVAGSYEGQERTPNQTRDMIRAAVKEDRNRKILALYATEQSKASIARELGVSRNTVLKVINEDIVAREAARAAAQEEIEVAELQVAVGAEGAFTPVKGVLKNGANIYVSYMDDGGGGSGSSPPRDSS